MKKSMETQIVDETIELNETPLSFNECLRVINSLTTDHAYDALKKGQKPKKIESLAILKIDDYLEKMKKKDPDWECITEQDFIKYEGILLEYANSCSVSCQNNYGRRLYNREYGKFYTFNDVGYPNLLTDGRFVWIENLLGVENCFWSWDEINLSHALRKKSKVKS
ncbi:MAG: hypothetical protein AABZ74_18380 [Cyanobacteriota bacterium]